MKSCTQQSVILISPESLTFIHILLKFVKMKIKLDLEEIHHLVSAVGSAAAAGTERRRDSRKIICLPSLTKSFSL